MPSRGVKASFHRSQPRLQAEGACSEAQAVLTRVSGPSCCTPIPRRARLRFVVGIHVPFRNRRGAAVDALTVWACRRKLQIWLDTMLRFQFGVHANTRNGVFRPVSVP